MSHARTIYPKKSSRITVAGIAALVAFSMTGCGGGAQPAAQDSDGHAPVSISAIMPLAQDSLEMEGFGIFLDTLEEVAPWIDVNVTGGPEVVPSLDQAEAVSNGAFDMAPVLPGYIEGYIPGAPSMLLTPNEPAEDRAAGTYDLYNELLFAPKGLTYLGDVQAHVQMTLWLGEDAGASIDPADPSLAGRVIRGGGQYSAAVESLDGSLVNMPIGEVYTAVERGVIDGFGSGDAGLDQLGLTDVVAYEMEPSFKHNTIGLAVNSDWWNSLAPEARDAMTEAMEAAEPKIESHYLTRVEEDKAARRAAGIKELVLEPAAADEYVEMIEDRAWDEALSHNPELQQLRDHWNNR
jgi:TRAP-type transport system periplasmic protein